MNEIKCNVSNCVYPKGKPPAPQMKLWSAVNAATSPASAVKPSAAHFRRKTETAK